MTEKTLNEIIAELATEMEAEQKRIDEQAIPMPEEIKRLYMGVAALPKLTPGMTGVKQGALVKVRIASEEQTRVGIMLGDLPMGASVSAADDILLVREGSRNPCIWVPELNQLVFGAESWWGEIKSLEELRDITDEDIENLWYVQALKQLNPDAVPSE